MKAPVITKFLYVIREFLKLIGKEHVTSSSSSLNAIELREQLVGVGFPVAIEVVLNVADRYFLAWKAAMLQSSELSGDELLILIDQFVFAKNGEMMSPFDQLKLYNLIWKHLTRQRDIQVKLCTFDALYGFTDKVPFFIFVAIVMCYL